MLVGVGGKHIMAQFLLKSLTFHLHKLLLGIRRIEKKLPLPQAKCFRKSFRDLPLAKWEPLLGSCRQPVSDVISVSN